MANKPLDKKLAQEAVDIYVNANYNKSAAASFLGLPRKTFNDRMKAAERYGIKIPAADIEVGSLAEEARIALRRHAYSLDALADRLHVTRGVALDVCDNLRNAGLNIVELGGMYQISTEPVPQHAGGDLPVYTSRPDNTYLFGFTSDNHLCSKYERLDVLENLYDQFVDQGVDRVFNAGNWIDGEASFNKFEIHTRGMDAQLAYLASYYPQRAGITTYAVSGDDHEGWYCQREGVNIGAYAEMKMREAGRSDFVHMGYMEAFVRLINANSGRESKLLDCHPGGGSSYAISYTSQKSVEAFEGGEKPAVALFGHYHKMEYMVNRNVHCIQTGCTEDQTTFMRKKKLSAQIGGGIVQLRQDEVTGSISACRVEFFNYFNKGFYNDRWSLSGKAKLPERM